MPIACALLTASSAVADVLPGDSCDAGKSPGDVCHNAGPSRGQAGLCVASLCGTPLEGAAVVCLVCQAGAEAGATREDAPAGDLPPAAQGGCSTSPSRGAPLGGRSGLLDAVLVVMLGAARRTGRTRS